MKIKVLPLLWSLIPAIKAVSKEVAEAKGVDSEGGKKIVPSEVVEIVDALIKAIRPTVEAELKRQFKV